MYVVPRRRRSSIDLSAIASAASGAAGRQPAHAAVEPDAAVGRTRARARADAGARTRPPPARRHRSDLRRRPGRPGRGRARRTCRALHVRRRLRRARSPLRPAARGLRRRARALLARSHRPRRLRRNHPGGSAGGARRKVAAVLPPRRRLWRPAAEAPADLGGRGGAPRRGATGARGRWRSSTCEGSTGSSNHR